MAHQNHDSSRSQVSVYSTRMCSILYYTIPVFFVIDTWEGVHVALIAEGRCDPDVEMQVPASTNSEEMELLKKYLHTSTSVL